MIFISFIIFAHSLTVSINQQQYTGEDYYAILQSYGSEVNTIKSLKVIEGNFYLSSITKQYTQLSVLEIPEKSFTGSVQTEQFKDMISLQEVILNGVTSIGSNSFQNCIQLETIQLSSCLTIGNYAFSGCLLLTTVILPKLTTIGSYAFEKVGLTEIELNSAYVFNTKLDILRGLEGCQFSGCSKLKRVTMKNAPLIQRYMFENCNSLVYVDMPNCLRIGDRSFIGCNSYNNVTFPYALSIGSYAFYSLTGITDINLPFVNAIGERAFSKCVNLRTASFDFCVTIEEECFSDCSSLERINFPSVTKLGPSAFSNSGLIEVKMNSLVELETEFELFVGDVGRQFSGCSRLTTVTMNSLQTVKSYTFENCELLNELNIPSCTTIELNGLIECKNIRKVSLGYPIVNFISIPNPTILTHIYFPYALVVLESTFASMNELVSCRLPMITKVFPGLFRDHSKLTEVLLPRVKEIEGDFVFYNCENLELVSLQSLTTVNRNSQNLFSGCTGLKYIYLPNKPPRTFNSATFQGLTCSIVIPNDSIKIYDNDVSIDGDIANDNKWCGIDLKVYSFVNCSINLLWNGIGFSVHDCIRVAGMTDSNVVILRIQSGHITQEEMNSMKNDFVYLKELIIDESVTIENEMIPDNFMIDHKEIVSVTINCNVKSIGSSSFEGCSKLKIFNCKKVTELNSRCFYGPTSIESLTFDSVTSLKGSDFFSNNAKLTTIYLPKLTQISVTGFVAQKSPLITSVLLPKSPPTVTSGTFLIESQPNLIGVSNDEAKIYDAADGVNNDMKYYSLNLTYTLITCLIDGRLVGGINLKGTVRKGDKMIQVIEGEIFESDFPLPFSVISFTISEKVVTNIIPRNALSQNPNLKTVTILSTNEFIVDEEAFSGCQSFVSVKIDGATKINGLAFKDCVQLKYVVLDKVQEIVGNFNFDGCLELDSLSLKSLVKVPTESSMIFRGCVKLSTIKLPSIPPLTFNKDAFGGIQSHVTLSLPSENDYKTYDNDKRIDGDIENDGFWCGLLLPTETISIDVNELNNPIYVKDINDCISLSGIPENSIKSIEILQGIGQVSSFMNLIENLPLLEKLSVSKSVVFTGDFTEGMFSGLGLISIKLPSIQTIPSNFFKDCRNLKNVDINDAMKICDSAFSGCTSLETIHLNAEELEGDSHFEGCTSLSVVSLTNLKTVNSNSLRIFSGCPLTSIYLSSIPPQTFNKGVFAGKQVFVQGLTIDELKLYDSNTDVEGDVINDRKWCGIDLIQLYIYVSINQKSFVYTDTLSNAISSSQIGEVTSIEIQKGLVKKTHFNELKQFTSLKSFKICEEAFLESSNIETDYFNDMKSLFSVSIMQDISLIHENSFCGCSSLQSVEFKSVYQLDKAVFKDCTSLSSLSIPNVAKLNGDEVFSRCSSLKEIDLSSLEIVESSATKIFEGCSQLATINLPSKEPLQFHKNTFKDMPNVKLVFPAYDDYVAYDDESNVIDDVKEDGKWCGVQLNSNYLPPLLTFKINEIECKSRKIESNGKSNIEIKTLELIDGIFDPLLVKNTINKYKSTIEKFEVKYETLSEILSGTFYECNSLKEIEIHSDVKIDLNALQNIPNLVKISLDLVQTIRSDEFKGDSNLQEVSLPLLTTVPSLLFYNLQNLKTVNLNSTSTILGECFKNCYSLTNVELSKVTLISGDSHFEGCYSIEKVDLSGLKTVNQTSENIFKNCSKLSQIKLGNEPPLLFNENVFVNAGVVPNVSIPNNENWVNYISQSTIDPSSNHYIWFGYDTGLEKNKNKCPKNQKTTVIVLAVFTALFGAGLIGFVVYFIVMSCSGYIGVEGAEP